MLDIKFIKENLDLVKNACKVKGFECDVDRLIELETIVRQANIEIQELKTEQNILSKKIKSASDDERPNIVEFSKKIRENIKKKEEKLAPSKDEYKALLLAVPLIPEKTEPIGSSELENVTIRQEGEKPEFSFEPLSQIELAKRNNWADFQRVSDVCGARSVLCLKGKLAKLEFALYNYIQDKMEENGFTQLNLPALIKKDAIFDAGHFPGDNLSVMDRDVFSMSNDDRALAGTSEIAINSLHAGEVLDVSNLPLLYTAYSTCFRREAGSAGKDTSGFIRGNQFNKQEMFIFCENSEEESHKWFDKMLGLFEEFIKDMELSYRILATCTADMGFNHAKMHDLEAWLPSQERYVELGSCSLIYDFQARRTNTRYKDEEGKLHFCHTLNNTCLATPRFLAVFIENHQTKGGKVRLPEKIRPYMKGAEFL